MQPRTRIGLIVGMIGLVLNICVAGFVGFCGPFLALVAGGIAGFFAAQQEKPLTKNEGARLGATAFMFSSDQGMLKQAARQAMQEFAPPIEGTS